MPRGRNAEGNEILDPIRHSSVPGETHSDAESPRTPREREFSRDAENQAFYPVCPRKRKPVPEVGVMGDGSEGAEQIPLDSLDEIAEEARS